jgi:hypothetical protein
VRDLWAFDSVWSVTTAARPVRCSLEAGAVGTITLYPNPTDPGTVAQICQEYPPTLTAAAPGLAVPSILQDYFTYVMLAGARGKESDYRMGDMAQHYQQRCQMYEQVISSYWSGAQ